MERTVWVRLERDALGPEAVTYSAPPYVYGKVTGLYPDVNVMTETTERPYVCCAYCSGGMACRTARTGLSAAMSATAHPIRSKGGRPHNNGATASEVRKGARAAHNVTLSAIAISEVPGRLRGGYAVTAAVQYEKLPAYLKVQSNSFGHSVMLRGWKVSGSWVGFYDPLWSQGARGAWARWSDVKRALWSDGNHSTTTAKLSPPVQPPSPPEPPIPPTSPVLPAAGVWVPPGPSWDLVTWNESPGRAPSSWWDVSPWQPAGYVTVWGIDGWSRSDWTSGRW
jgi:hypothetical protein